MAEASAARPGDPVRRAWQVFHRLTRLGFPQRFPIVQFPNVPLLAALAAGWASQLFTGPVLPYLTSAGYLAMTVWAYEELARGANWFRRLLGVAFLIITAVRVAHAV